MTLYKMENGKKVALTEAEMQQRAIDEAGHREATRAQLIRRVKDEAGRRIREIAPEWKQINILLENPQDVVFEAIKEIRDASDTIEAKIASLEFEELALFDFSDMWP